MLKVLALKYSQEVLLKDKKKRQEKETRKRDKEKEIKKKMRKRKEEEKEERERERERGPPFSVGKRNSRYVFFTLHISSCGIFLLVFDEKEEKRKENDLLREKGKEKERTF